jgi:hypothetical protein
MNTTKIIRVTCIIATLAGSQAVALNPNVVQLLSLLGSVTVGGTGLYLLNKDLGLGPVIEISKNIGASCLTAMSIATVIGSMTNFKSFAAQYPYLVQPLAYAGAASLAATGIYLLSKEKDNNPYPQKYDDQKHTVFKCTYRLVASCIALAGIVPLGSMVI